MAFNPANVQPTDTVWLLSKYCYNRLRAPHTSMGKSMGATARRVVNEFFRMCREVDYDLSKLKFQIMDFEPRSIPLTIGIEMKKKELEQVCRAGRFGPDEILEIALSCQGKKQ